MFTTTDLTIDNFSEKTGFRFRISREQKVQIDAGTLTREQAFQEFLNNGGLERLQNRNPQVPDSFYLDPSLTIDNFAEKTKQAIGVSRRFRISREQKARIDAGTLTREQAFAEFIAAKGYQI